MEATTIIGTIAGAFAMFSSVPQVIKTWRTKSVDDVAIGTYIMIFVSAAL